MVHFWLTASASSGWSPTPPNLVFLLVDDSGFNDIGFTNEGVAGRPTEWQIKTPKIDALARAGVRLSNYYVQPICTPTRAALLTGRYPFRYGVTGYTIDADAPWGIPVNETFLSEHLKDAGYETAIFGKWHLGFFKRALLPSSRGFDHQSGLYNAQGDHFAHTIDGGYDWHVDEVTQLQFAGNYSGEIVRDDAVAFIRRVQGPFFSVRSLPGGALAVPGAAAVSRALPRAVGHAGPAEPRRHAQPQRRRDRRHRRRP